MKLGTIGLPPEQKVRLLIEAEQIRILREDLIYGYYFNQKFNFYVSQCSTTGG